MSDPAATSWGIHSICLPECYCLYMKSVMCVSPAALTCCENSSIRAHRLPWAYPPRLAAWGVICTLETRCTTATHPSGSVSHPLSTGVKDHTGELWQKNEPMEEILFQEVS